MSVLCCIMCVCITECAMHTAYSTTDSESVSLQNPLHKIYSKSITKNI